MPCIQKRIVRNIVSVDETASCAEAARCMADHGIGSVGVRRGARVVGLVTERDLLAALARGEASDERPVREVLRADLPFVTPQATDKDCAQLMRTLNTRHLAVKERGEMVGILSMLDLVDLVIEDTQAQVEQLESYIRGGRALALSQPTRTIFEHGVGA